MKIRRLRGRTLRSYLLIVAFGVGSSFYIYNPVIKQLEQKTIGNEQQSALVALEAAKKPTS